MTKKRTIPTLSRLVFIFSFIGTLVLLMAGTFMLVQAGPPIQDAENGEVIFKAKCVVVTQSEAEIWLALI